MKNASNFPLLALAISLSIVACKSSHSGNAADSAQKEKADSSISMKSTTDTTVKTDSSKATDTSKAKLDTVSKTITKHTVIKKTIVKKN
jgi:hypothetical protein